METLHISFLERVLSYIYPITKKIKSDYNGTLEITYSEGKKVLNTQNANYSFGNLHKVMQFALNKVGVVKNNKPILLLGLGAGSALSIVRDELLIKNPIDVVEIDNTIITIAKKEFHIDKYSNVTIHCQDAYQYVQKKRPSYVVIIIDLFFDTYTPSCFYTDIFWNSIIKHASKKSFIIFNTLSINNIESEIITIKNLLTNAGFIVQIHDGIVVSNTVIIAER